MALPFKFSKTAGAIYRSLYAEAKRRFPAASPQQIQQAVLQQMGKAGYRVYNNTVYSPEEIRAMVQKIQQRQQTQRAPARNPPPPAKKSYGGGPAIYAMGKRIF